MGAIIVFYDLYLELCKEKNISPTRAAIELGISKATPTTWKKRGLTPQGETLNKIANYFGVTTDYLLGNVTEPFFYLDNERILREINSYGNEDEKALTPGGERQVSDDDIRAAFFGGADDLSAEEMDAMWNDAKDYIQYKLEQRRRKKNGGAD